MITLLVTGTASMLLFSVMSKVLIGNANVHMYKKSFLVFVLILILLVHLTLNGLILISVVLMIQPLLNHLITNLVKNS